MFLQSHIHYWNTINSLCNMRPLLSDVLRMGTNQGGCTVLPLMTFLDTSMGEHPTSSTLFTYKATNKLRLISWQARIPADAVLRKRKTEKLNMTPMITSRHHWLILTLILLLRAGSNFVRKQWVQWWSGKKARLRWWQFVTHGCPFRLKFKNKNHCVKFWLSSV